MRLLYSSQFKKDSKKIKKRGKDFTKLYAIVDILMSKDPLPAKHRDHKLIGEWKDFRDCHIEADWILIYKITADSLILQRTGSHSDLFK